MINSIKIKNFETHLNTNFDLHPGVNTFVGESDEGKSGIIRAIKWNTKNRPQGDSYRNDQLDSKKKADKLKKVQVGIDYKDGNLVTRARNGVSGGINIYQIDNAEPLRALRTDIPDEVQEVTKMKDVNIQGQHPTEQYFLLADNPGQVAKKFNKVAGLTVMDDAIKSINSQVRTCNAEINISKEEIENKEKELKETTWILKANKFAKKLLNLKEEIRAREIFERILTGFILPLEKISTELKKYNGIEAAKIALDELKKQKNEIINKESIIKQTNELILDIKSVDSELKCSVDTVKALTLLKSLQKQKVFINKYHEQINLITSLLLKINTNEEEFQIADRDWMEARKEYEIIREEKNCPTCGRSGK